MFANLSALAALGTLAPFSLGVSLGRHAGLAGKMHDDAAGNVLAAIREASIELEGFKQDGEAEPGGARFVVELGEFVGVPVLLHRVLRGVDRPRLRLGLPKEELQAQLKVTLGPIQSRSCHLSILRPKPGWR
jgi:hypothetical protein